MYHRKGDCDVNYEAELLFVLHLDKQRGGSKFRFVFSTENVHDGYLSCSSWFTVTKVEMIIKVNSFQIYIAAWNTRTPLPAVQL